MATTFKLNGKSVSVDADASTPLLWTLRDHLGMTGTKFGCGAALCGACTVHMNGAAIRSCITPLSAVAGADVRTIEALARRSGGPRGDRRLGQERRRAVRLLPERPGDERGGAVEEEQAPERRADRRRDGRQHLPLRHLPAHPRRDPRRRHGDGLKQEPTMIIDHLLRSVTASPADVTRRRFVTMSVGGSVGLALLPWAAAQQKADVPPGQKPTEQPSAFVSIAPDGTTTVICNRMDMGQGIETALAMVCAEELGADWSKVKTGFGTAAPNYVDPAFGMHLTGGSNSVKNSYTQYRELGARTRAMLIAAAAKRWNVPASSLDRGQRRGARRRSLGRLRRAVRRRDEGADSRAGGAEGPEGLQADRQAHRAEGVARQVERPADLRHGHQAARHAGGGDRASAGVRRQGQDLRCRGGAKGDRRARGVAGRARPRWPRRRGGGQRLLAGQDRPRRAEARVGHRRPREGRQHEAAGAYRELARTPGTPAPGEHLRADVSRIATAPQPHRSRVRRSRT